MADKLFDRKLGARLRLLREHQGLSLGALADRSGVSKAMIARVEKAQSSATAALLGRLCAGLGVRLSSDRAADTAPSRCRGFATSPSGEIRRPAIGAAECSPPAALSGLEIALIASAGQKVPYRAWTANAYRSSC